MTSVLLGEISSFVRGITFKPSDVVPLGQADAIVCMRTKNVQATLDCSDLLAVPASFAKRPNQLLAEGDILISSANSWNLVGKCCWIPQLPSRATFGGFVTVLRPDMTKVFPRYLYWWFSSPTVQELVRSFGQKTTNISNLNLDRCRTLQVPLPSMLEQRRIAAILDQADALRAKRRETLAELDRLTQAIFIDMFGDPIANPRCWPLVKLEKVGTLDRGVSRHRPRNDPKLLGGRYPLIQTGDVANCDGYIRSFSSTYSDVGLQQSRLWPAGTLCITIAANIAKTGVLTFDACFPDSVVGFTALEPETVEYVRVWLSFLQRALEESAPESAQKNINLATLRGLSVPLPPLKQRRVFLSTINQGRKVAEECQASSRTMEQLFASLQHRAFRGEL